MYIVHNQNATVRILRVMVPHPPANVFRGSSTSYLLCIPFRRSPPVSLSEPIKKYISSKYDQHPEQFEKDLEAIDQMRTAAIHATDPHVSGIKKLQAYAAQLVWISGKFPIDVRIHFALYRVDSDG